MKQNYDIGKLPPQAIEIECAVLGAMLLEKEACETVINILLPESFYQEQNGRIFNAILILYKNKRPIDILTVIEQLKSTNELELVGGSYYVSDLTSRMASSANIEFHAYIVAQKHLQRELIRVGTETIKKGFEPNTDVFELISELKSTVETIEHKIYQVNTCDSTTTIFSKAVQEIKADYENTAELIGQPTGLKALDNITGGLINEVVVIGGTPGTGKTALLINMIYENAIKNNYPVQFFSLEMTAIKIAKRIISHALEISGQNINRGNLLQDQIQQIDDFVLKIKENLTIDDTAGITWQYVETKIRQLRKTIPKTQLLVVMIDYIQLMRNTADEEKGKTKEDIVATRVNNLQRIAKVYNCCMIELSQLSREVTKRSNPRPTMSDLKESSAIEANAHQIWLLYKPDMYENKPIDEKGNDLTGLCEIGIVKNREGNRGKVYSRFLGQYSKYLPHIEDAEIKEPF